MTDEMIFVTDAHKAGYCIKGQREWCKNNNVDYVDYIRNGVAVSKLPPNNAVVAHILKVKNG